MSNKKVLIVTYYWPPASSPGVQRWLKFTKFLQKYGWDSIVITPEDGSYPNIDPTLLDDIPASTKVVTTKTLEPFRIFNILSGNVSRGKITSVGMGDIKGKQSLLKKISGYIRANWFIPDARKGWVPFALKAGQKIIDEENIRAIVTTGPPHSSHFVGKELSEKNDIPWLADFRDPWTNIYYNNFLPRTKKTKRIDYKLESQVLSGATIISTVSSGLVNEFKDRAKSISLLPNGYDEEDFQNIKPNKKSEFFEISYIGNLKENQNCEGLWVALKELKEADNDFERNARISLIGNIHPSIVNSIEHYGIGNLILIESFVQHHIAVKRMVTASSLLFIIPQTVKNHQIITGKIFEYLASRTPLLSIGPVEGDASRILNDCSRSSMIDYSDIESIKSRIKTLYIDWKQNGKTTQIENNLHQKYSREQLSKQLAVELDGIVDGS